jgi:hypothetical protein
MCDLRLDTLLRRALLGDMLIRRSGSTWGNGVALVAALGCSGGQTGDVGDGAGDCVIASVEQVSLGEAADRGFNVRGWLTNLLGAEHVVERDVVVSAPSALWLEEGALPPSNRTTSGTLRLEATSTATITTFEEDAETQCPTVAEGNVDFALALTEPPAVLAGKTSVLPEYVADRYLWVELASFTGPVELRNPPRWDFFTGGSISDRLFRTENYLVASTECEKLTSTSKLSVGERTVSDWLALAKITTGLELSLSCSSGTEEEGSYTVLPDRDLSLQLTFPEEFCPSRAQPRDVTAVASAAFGNTQFDNLDAWIRPEAAGVTVYLSPSLLTDQTRSEGILLSLSLGDKRELAVTYVLWGEPSTTCSARVPVP